MKIYLWKFKYIYFIPPFYTSLLLSINPNLSPFLYKICLLYFHFFIIHSFFFISQYFFRYFYLFFLSFFLRKGKLPHNKIFYSFFKSFISYLYHSLFFTFSPFLSISIYSFLSPFYSWYLFLTLSIFYFSISLPIFFGWRRPFTIHLLKKKLSKSTYLLHST